jgi:hypothetical protein
VNDFSHIVNNNLKYDLFLVVSISQLCGGKFGMLSSYSHYPYTWGDRQRSPHPPNFLLVEMGSQELFARAGLEPQSSQSVDWLESQG